jgi:hypothetical protein
VFVWGFLARKKVIGEWIMSKEKLSYLEALREASVSTMLDVVHKEVDMLEEYIFLLERCKEYADELPMTKGYYNASLRADSLRKTLNATGFRKDKILVPMLFSGT